MFDHLPKYHMKVLLGDFIEEFETEDVFKSRIGNGSLLWDRNFNSIRVVNFATSENLLTRSTFISYHIYLFTFHWIFTDMETVTIIHNT